MVGYLLFFAWLGVFLFGVACLFLFRALLDEVSSNNFTYEVSTKTVVFKLFGLVWIGLFCVITPFVYLFSGSS